MNDSTQKLLALIDEKLALADAATECYTQNSRDIARASLRALKVLVKGIDKITALPTDQMASSNQGNAVLIASDCMTECFALVEGRES
jgi:hypothetical protein